jgi:hypothetical protein
MPTTPFEPPPRINVESDENGYVKIKSEEFEKFMQWVWRFVKHVASIT